MANRLIAGLLAATLVVLAVSARPARAAMDPAAKAAIKCQGAILQSGAKFVKTKLSLLQGCVGSILSCIETKAGSAKCLASSDKKCTSAFANILNAEGAFAKALATGCKNVSAASLNGSDGLGYVVDAGECLKNFGADVNTTDGVVTCIVREHARTAEQVFALEEARTMALLKFAGVSTTTLCDVPTNPDCLDAGPQGCMVPPPPGGKDVASCAATVAKGGSTFLQKTIAVLAKCTKATFGCAVTPISAKTDACHMKATATCTTAFATLMAARAALSAKIEAAKSCTAMPFGTLADASALNLGVLGSACAKVGASGTVDTLAAYAQCLHQQHECEVQALTPFAAPRFYPVPSFTPGFPDLLDSVGLTDPLNPLCPPPTPIPLTGETLGAPIRAAVAAINAADAVDVGSIISAITSPSGGTGSFTPGGMKVSTPGASNSVTGASGDVTFQRHPKPIKIAYTACGDATVTPKLVVSANDATGALLPGFFVLTPPATDQGKTDIDVTFQPTVQSCVRLAFATDCGTGGVSNYVQFEQVPEIVPNETATPTPTATPGGSGFTFLSNGDNTVTITGYTGPGGAVAIPDAIDGLAVTGIDANAFLSACNMTSVTIPSSITNIGTTAFRGCGNLTAIMVDTQNAIYSSVGGVLFDKNQTTLLECPDGLSGDYTIPAGVTDIGTDAFNYCGLTSVTIPDGVTTIADGAFFGCSPLASVAIPSSVTSIGSEVFSASHSLTAITVDTHNPFFSSVGGVLFDKDQATLIAFPSGVSGDYAIPGGVTSIGAGAFFDGSLTSITVPSSVTSIGQFAFLGGGLTTITVDPDNLSYSTLDGALFDKSRTTLVEVSGAVNGQYTIPDGTTDIGDTAFYGQYSLTDVTIPNSVTTIGVQAFYNNIDLTSLTIPAGVISIETSAFAACFNLTTIMFQGDAPSADSTAFDGDSNATICYLPGSTGWTSPFAGLPAAPCS